MSALLDSPISRNCVAGDEHNPPVAADAPTLLPRAADKSPAPGDSGPKRALLLEDDASFREIMKVFLCEKGYVVHEAQSGLDGIQEVMAADFSIILCDMQMPSLAGDLFYRAVERSRPKLCERFIFMTGYRGDSMANDFIHSSKGRVLMKPFHLDQLSAVLEVVEGQGPSQEWKTNVAPASQAAAAMEPPPVQAPAVATTPAAKRILLLEDDLAFRAVMKEFLAEAGYTVREAQNGVEGIREIMGGDFAVILCDLMMPGLAGDLFYCGVQRVRPQLADRFIFMTGHRGDDKINEFIRKTAGRALVKPFGLEELLAAIGDVEKPRPAPLPAASAPGKSSPAAPEYPYPSRRLMAEPPPTVVPSAPANSTKATAVCAPLLVSSSPAVGRDRPRGLLARLVLPAFLALAGFALFEWHAALESRCEVLTADLAAATKERTVAAKELAEAVSLEAGLQAAVSAPERLRQERGAPKWTPVLGAVGPAFGGETEIQDLHARQISGPAGACELRIGGLSFGQGRRAMADDFRRRVEQELQRDPRNAPVKTGFLRLEDLYRSPAARNDRPTAAFEVVATARVENAPAIKRAPAN